MITTAPWSSSSSILTGQGSERSRPSRRTARVWTSRLGDGSAAGPDREAAVLELAERVHRIEAAEHRPGALGPFEGVGRRDAAVDLEDAALEHAVLGPGAREVLDARHLDPGHVAGRREAAHAVAVGVAGEVADK